MLSGVQAVRVRQALLVVGLMCLAAVLRFWGLAWGLRHPVHVDETYTVANVVDMVQAGDWDHRYYYYPGLFYYLLAPIVAALGPERMTSGWGRPSSSARFSCCRSTSRFEPWRTYYHAGPHPVGGAGRFLAHVGFYLRQMMEAVGGVGMLLCVIGAVIAVRRSPRSWGPPLLHPVTVLLVMSSASLVYARQILQAVPLLCILAGVVVDAVARRRGPWAAACLAGLAAFGPLSQSAAYDRSKARRATRIAPSTGSRPTCPRATRRLRIDQGALDAAPWAVVALRMEQCADGEPRADMTVPRPPE